MKHFRELKVWVKAHRLAMAVYAEGCGRDGDADLGRFLQIFADGHGVGQRG